MLKNLNARINYISYQLEYISMRPTMRAELLAELSKALKARQNYMKVMEEYGWTQTESSKDEKKK